MHQCASTSQRGGGHTPLFQYLDTNVDPRKMLRRAGEAYAPPRNVGKEYTPRLERRSFRLYPHSSRCVEMSFARTLLNHILFAVCCFVSFRATSEYFVVQCQRAVKHINGVTAEGLVATTQLFSRLQVSGQCFFSEFLQALLRAGVYIYLHIYIYIYI